jgi:hypothetical protein
MRIYEIIAEASHEDNMRELEKARDQIQQNRDKELAAWKKAVEKNFPQWLNKQPSGEESPEELPIEPPAADRLEDPLVMKSRIAALKQALEKRKLLNKYIKRAERHGLMNNSGLRYDTDISLYIKGAEKDNYKSLNDRLDRALSAITKRLGIYKTAFRRE